MKLPFSNKDIFEPHKNPVKKWESSYIWYKWLIEFTLYKTLLFNAQFVLALTFFRKLFIFQKAYFRKLSHFSVFGNDLENELENVFLVFGMQF